MKKIGYDVYHAPDGGCESYLGRVRTLRAARHLAAHGNELPKSLYATACAAGSVYGLYAPDSTLEDNENEPQAWFGRNGCYCAVPVYE